jgi:hypothetical protein
MSPKTDNNTRNIIVPRGVKNTNNFMIDFETGKQEGELTLQVPETESNQIKPLTASIEGAL